MQARFYFHMSDTSVEKNISYTFTLPNEILVFSEIKIDEIPITETLLGDINALTETISSNLSLQGANIRDGQFLMHIIEICTIHLLHFQEKGHWISLSYPEEITLDNLKDLTAGLNLEYKIIITTGGISLNQ